MNEEIQLIVPPVDAIQDFLLQHFIPFFLPFSGFVIANIAVYFYLSVGRVERHTEKAYSGLNPASTMSLWTHEGPCLCMLRNVHILRCCVRWISDLQEQSVLLCQNMRSSFHRQSFWLAPPRAGCLPLHRAGSAGILESSAAFRSLSACIAQTSLLCCSHILGSGQSLLCTLGRINFGFKYHCLGLHRNPSA